MKLGIFGGTFNPIHYGHLINAEIVRSDYNLDRIILVPARQPVHKPLDGNVPADERFAMAALAAGGSKEIEVSRIEIDREEPSYTITTVQGMLELHPGSELFLIIGMDSLFELERWRESDRLLERVSVIVMRRPGATAQSGTAPSAGRIFYADNPLIDISSTFIRERLRSGKSVRYLLPDPVIDYISRKGLYLN